MIRWLIGTTIVLAFVSLVSFGLVADSNGVKIGDDFHHQKSVTQSYTDNGNGTVTDNVTDLMWAKDGNGAGCNYGNKLSWNAAIDWAEGLTFAGYSDWRLPNISELESLVDSSRIGPAISTTYFPNTVSDYYWSGSTCAADTAYAWSVYFNHGNVRSYNKGDSYYVRAVRGGE